MPRPIAYLASGYAARCAFIGTREAGAMVARPTTVACKWTLHSCAHMAPAYCGEKAPPINGLRTSNWTWHIAAGNIAAGIRGPIRRASAGYSSPPVHHKTAYSFDHKTSYSSCN